MNTWDLYLNLYGENLTFHQKQVIYSLTEIKLL